jgi:hypothetical protein
MAIFQVLAEACIGKCQYWKSEGCALHLAKLRLRRKFISPQAPTSPQYDLGMPVLRHARACRGHPRLSCGTSSKQGVDGRDKPGHDKRRRAST